MDVAPVLLPAPRSVSLQTGTIAGSGVRQSIDRALGHPQGYRISLTADGIFIVAQDPAGAFYAQQTLAQLRRQCGDRLPQGIVEDWPDFVVRGVMLDISRDKVPTMQTLIGLIDLFASLKLNQLQLYTEHTFAYAGHEQAWRDASPITPDEIRILDAYCKERFIELVPNQNSFGHMERWLKHERYKPLAECEDGFTFPWGIRHEGGFSLNPLDPRSLELVEDLYDQLLPNFTSRMFNVGCDETFDLGLGKSKVECERRGKERVYLDFILKIHDAVSRRGRTMQFWGDIVLHKPELIPELPKDLIALNWGYEADHPFEKETKAFAEAGVPFYVCPGTSSWVTVTGRTDNALANLKSAAASGLANGAIGYLNTDWGDYGHLQYLPISYLGFAAGAAYSWCYAANESLNIPAASDAHVFQDRANVMGKLVFDLGNFYQLTSKIGNSSRFFWSLVGGEDRKKYFEPITMDELHRAQTLLGDYFDRLSSSKMQLPDAELVEDELFNACSMLNAACRVGIWRNDPCPEASKALWEEYGAIIDEHRRLWLARNREGGLNDSCRRLERMRSEF